MNMRCRGQAMVETLLASLLLVPLFMSIIALGDWQRAAMTATQSARFAALASSLTGRALTSPQLQVAWHERFPPFDGGDRIAVRRSAEPASARGDTRRLARALAPVQRITARPFALEQQGWLTAESQVGAPVPGVLRTLLGVQQWTLPARMTLLTEDGALGGRAALLRRLQPLAAMAPTQSVLTRMRPVGHLLSLLDPSFSDLCATPPDPDLLPADRLRGGRVTETASGGCP